MGTFFSKSFNPATDIPDLTGRVAVVTGSNTGIGYHTAFALASHGAKVYLAARSETKAMDAIRRMEEADESLVGTGRLVWLPLDLGSIRKSRRAAEEFLEKESRLDLLVNNAGLMGTLPYTLTEEGFEQIIATNHLGHFAFTTTLLPTLEATAKLAGSDVRIINISSEMYVYATKEATFTAVDDFKKPWAPDSSKDSFINKQKRYGLSKLANILFANELQRRFDEKGIPALAISLHPGLVATAGALTVLSNLGVLGSLLRSSSYSPEQGAATSLFAAASAAVKANADRYKGQYLVPYGQVQQKSKQAEDRELSEQLWKISEKIVEDFPSVY